MKFVFLYVLIKVHVVYYIKSETGGAYQDLPQAKEIFFYNDKPFYFYSDKVSWNEGKAICEANNMHLATLDGPEKVKFAARSIAEAWTVFEEMWIGGTKIGKEQWHWDYTNNIISKLPFYQMRENYTFTYPPWINNEIPSDESKNCLAINIIEDNYLYFVDLSCKIQKPFICEQNTKVKKDEPREGGIIKVFGIEYILYHGRLSWPEAVSFCWQQGYSLATIESMAVAKKLAKAMLRARPQFNNAWIGANLKNDRWVWVENGEEIKITPSEYTHSYQKETAENIVTLELPSWYERTSKDRTRQCAIFERHTFDQPKFIDLQCNRQREFICMSKMETSDIPAPIQVLDRGRKRYLFFDVEVTWEEAEKICDEEGEHTTMLSLTDLEETKFIMQVMATAKNPISHLWLGGKIDNGQWVWIGRELSNKKYTKIPAEPDEGGFPPWCDNEINIERACLNLDRQYQWTPYMYGLECNSTQAVVCVQPLLN